jgi:hypothetical protein
VLVRQRDIHHDQIGLQRFDRGHALVARRKRAADMEARLGLDCRDQSLPDHHMVVDDQDLFSGQ